MSAVFLLATSGDPLSLPTPPPCQIPKISRWGGAQSLGRFPAPTGGAGSALGGCRDHISWLGGAGSRTEAGTWFSWVGVTPGGHLECHKGY